MSSEPLPPAPPVPTHRSTSSAFSRLANIASLSSSASPSPASASPASSSNHATNPPLLPNLPPQSQPPSHPHPHPPSTTSTTRALDALETIVHADLETTRRQRHGSTDSSVSSLVPSGVQPSNTTPGGGGGGGPSMIANHKRASWNASNSGIYPRGGGGGRDSSNSRSRERGEKSSDSTSSGFLLSTWSDSPRNSGPAVGGGGNSNGYWGSGTEVIPSESHFFQPGAGSSGFSFEHQRQPHYRSNSSGVGSYWDGSYRSSITGSPSIFGSVSNSAGGMRLGGGGGTSTSQLPSQKYPWSTSATGNLSAEPSTSNGGGGSSTGSSSASPLNSAAAIRGRIAQSYSLNDYMNLSRSASPIGGGRKLKEFSRGLRYELKGTSREEQKGLIGLAKPPKNSSVVGTVTDIGRVAVAGKHSLKILKVPHGPTDASVSGYATRRHPSTSSSYANVARSSSIADRRSRSRGPKQSDGSFVGGGSIRDGSSSRVRSGDGGGEDARGSGGGGGEGESAEDQVMTVEEVVDVRSGSRLSPSYLFQDVRWGYGATSSKLATACTNGAVILWDLNRDGGTKLDQVKYEHDRAVNRIVFGGQTGNWLMSGGQDGQMKLWDIRESRPSSMILKASSPVRHLSFSPSASQPFTLLAACASGTLIRYDVRYISRQNGGATDRIAGHIGSCLAMDWRDGFDCEKLPGHSLGGGGVGVSQETAGGGKEGGWVVTGGIDSTIKIWDFSLPTLATKPIRTLYPSQPVQCVSWHPTNGSELASCPLPSLSLGRGVTGKGDEASVSITPVDRTENAFLRTLGDGPGHTAGRGSNWKNEISLWDTRRPYFPKLSIKTEEPTSAILFNDDETIWSTSKTSSTFNQHDTASDSYSLLDCIDRPSTAWNLEGDFVFVDDSRTSYDIPFERSRSSVPVNSEKFVPDVHFAAVTDIDPDFSTESFTQLANNLKLTGDFEEICDHNIHVSFLAGRPDAAQVWAVLKTWFGETPLSTPDSPLPTPPTEDEPAARDERASSPLAPAPDWILSPTSTTYSEAASKSGRQHRFSLSSMKSSPSSRRQLSSDTFDSSATALPKESIKQLLDTFSEESTASETDPSAQSPYYPELSSTSSDSEHDTRHDQRRRMHKSSLASLPTNRLAASLAALAESQNRVPDSEISLDDVHKHSSRTPSRLRSRRNSTSSSASSSDSGDISSFTNDDDPEGGGGGASERRDSTNRKSSRAAKIAALHASLIANRSRRPSAGQSSERRPLRSRDSTLGGPNGRMTSRKQSAEGNSESRRGSAARINGHVSTQYRSMSTGTTAGRPNEDLKAEPTMSSQDLGRQASAAYAAQAFQIVKEQLKATLTDYADRGDSQLCAIVCCVLQERDLGFDSLWVARVTKAYLDMLRSLDLHVPAATLNKYCATELLRNLTQESVVFHTACGRCGKGIEQPPYDFCPKCRLIITRCGICHLAVTSLYVFCACCGHGLHEQCLQNFAGHHANPAAVSQPQTPNTVPSTPGIATPLRRWLYGSESASVASEEEGLDIADRFSSLSFFPSCPSACSHSC